MGERIGARILRQLGVRAPETPSSNVPPPGAPPPQAPLRLVSGLRTLRPYALPIGLLAGAGVGAVLAFHGSLFGTRATPTGAPLPEASTTETQAQRPNRRLNDTLDIGLPHLHQSVVFSPRDPYLLHIQSIQSALTSKGTPLTGRGVRVLVSEGGGPEHARGVARTIVSPEYGLAPGATLELVSKYSSSRTSVQATAMCSEERALRRFGRAPTTATIKAEVLWVLADTADRVRSLTARCDGQRTVLATASFGHCPVNTARSIVKDAAASEPHSPVGRWLDQFSTEPMARLKGVAEHIARVVADLERDPQLTAARLELDRALLEAKNKRLLIYFAAGNDFDDVYLAGEDAKGASKPYRDGALNLVTVGSTNLGDPAVVGDERISHFSSEGTVTLTAPGENLPVLDDGHGSGTSYSVPYAVAAAALMLEANPSLTPDEIVHRQVMTAAPVAGKRSGAGSIDVLRALDAGRSAPGPMVAGMMME